MKNIVTIINKSPPFIILLTLLSLGTLLGLNHFGFAEKFGNFFLALGLLITILKIFTVKLQMNLPSTKFISSKLIFTGWLVILITGLLIFKAIFTAGPAIWGDAPYFYHENFKNYFPEPLSWESRGTLGVVNDLYFLYPVMFVFYSLGVLGLSSEIIIRLFFYMPAIFLSLISPWLFGRFFGFSSIVCLFTSLVYAFSTYFIMLIDGGQIGIALAYGLFPLATLSLFKLKAENTKKQFFISLSIFMLQIIVDVRFAIMAFFTFTLWIGGECFFFKSRVKAQQLKRFSIFGVLLILLSLYWLIPAFLLEPTTGAGTRSDLQLISVLNPLLIFASHWPVNEFGKITTPFWFFIGLPILIFSNLFFKKNFYNLTLILLFLFFVFLTKGETGYFKDFYSFLVEKIPFGGAFRDSTKFFAPLALLAGILIGLSVENFSSLFKQNLLKLLPPIVIFIYILSLITPAILGNLNGVLAGRQFPSDLQISGQILSEEPDFFRTVWFPERNQLSFNTERNPAIDGKSLVNIRPLASLNVGTSDRFNFLHNEQFLQWLDILGIRFLFLSDDPRKILPNKEQEKDWEKLLSLISGINDLKPVDWGMSFPVYQTETNKPRIFAVDKVIAVVGGEDIYNKLIKERDFSIGNQGFLFFEDGKFDPTTLDRMDKDSLIIYFNKKEKIDLTLSLLSKYFKGPMESKKINWALRQSGEYLKWKFELLTNKVETYEFDYGKGVAFSSIPSEKVTFNITGKKNENYILAVRYMSATESSSLKMVFLNQNEELPMALPGQFKWFLKEVKLDVDSFDLELENPKGFYVINIVAFIPKKDFEDANEQTEKILSKFKVINFSDPVPESYWNKVNHQMIVPFRYKVLTGENNKWIVFSDSYNKQWVLKSDKNSESSLPFYSSLNGFYTANIKEGEIVFEGQEIVRKGVYLSLLSLLIIAGFLIFNYSKRR